MTGIQINLVTSDRLAELTINEKIRLILDTVTEGNIIILETGLTPEEEGELVEVTMTRISPNGFNGVEIERQNEQGNSGGFLNKLLSSDTSTKPIMLIGPSGSIQTLEKSNDILTTLIKS